MKSYSHLWEEHLSEGNYYAAVQNATRHKGGKKSKYRRARRLRENAEEAKAEMLAYAEHFTPDVHKPKIIFDGSKRRLHRIRKATEAYLDEELGLHLNRRWQVFLFHYIDREGRERGRFLDFMGFRFYRNRTTLRRSMLYRATRKARRIARAKPRTAHGARQMMSYAGWLKAADVYGAYMKWIKPHVSFRQLRRITAAAQRRINEQEARMVCGEKTPTATA